MSPLPPIEKDVQFQLLNSRKSRRKPGEVPYPLEYNNGMVDFDIWDHMFFVDSYKSLTRHKFEKPPEVILDLGCGGGFWALEAAKQWPSSTVIGFDIAQVQPNLHDLEQFRYLARRIKWVHGNLLDGLPFPESQFDFVRIAYIGLGIPEDEWQFVLEEISRVMKPGAILEVIEEDLIFPCTHVPPPSPPSLNLNLDFNFSSLSPSSASSTTLTNSINLDRKPLPSPLRTKIQDLTRVKTPSKTQLSHALPLRPGSSFNSEFSSDNTVPQAPLWKHPQDHSRIKASWDAMLALRFLTPQLLSVLPFYLSTFFGDVTPHPLYKIPLPPNSNSIPQLRLRHSAESFRPSSRGKLDIPFDLKPVSNLSHSTKADGCSIRGMYSVKDPAGSSHWHTMHLAKTVNTIAACKGPIYRQYERLYTDDYNFHYRDSDVTFQQVFERDWNSWYNDMTDRMSMRDRLGTSLAWPEAGPGDRPDCFKWRNEFDPSKRSQTQQGPVPIMYNNPNDLCRSMRIFVARKTC